MGKTCGPLADISLEITCTLNCSWFHNARFPLDTLNLTKQVIDIYLDLHACSAIYQNSKLFLCLWCCSSLESQFQSSGRFGLSETRGVAQHKDVTPRGLLTAEHLIPQGLLTATQRVPSCSEAGMRFPVFSGSLQCSPPRVLCGCQTVL